MRCGYGWLIGISLMLAGCSTYVAHKIEHPDRSKHKALEPIHEYVADSGFSYEDFHTREGIRIAYWFGQPRAYAIRDLVLVSERDQHFKALITLGDTPAAASPLVARGSVVLLHPWEGEGLLMMFWAYHFAAAGYVVVMPDLRSQGGSGLAPVGYGPREGNDTAELVQALRAAHRLPDPLFVMGASYGGSAALFAAQRLGDVRGVIALEPYANAAAVIRQAPATGMFGPHWLASVVGASSVNRAIDRASRDLGVDLQHVDTSDAMTGGARCTLIVRGQHDSLLTADSLRSLAAHSPQASYVEVSDEGHISLPVRTDRLLAPALDWMAHVPATRDSDCPSFEPLPLPPPPTKEQRSGWTQFITIAGGA
jgi:pimeloyl-ACP methyl ester carboxylesterase